MRRNENLTVYYHCNEEYPQIISSFDQVSSEKDYEYPSTTPVIVTFRQKVSYLDAELKEHVATKTIKYFLGNLQNVTMWHGFRGRIGTVRNLRERPAGYPARAFGVYAASFGGRSDGAEIGCEG